jgi:hypothetical protein
VGQVNAGYLEALSGDMEDVNDWGGGGFEDEHSCWVRSQ